MSEIREFFIPCGNGGCRKDVVQLVLLICSFSQGIYSEKYSHSKAYFYVRFAPGIFSRKIAGFLYTRQFSGIMRISATSAGLVFPRGMVGETKLLKTAFDSAENIFLSSLPTACMQTWYECDSLFSLLCYNFVHTMSNGSAGTSSTIWNGKANADFVCGRYAGKQTVVYPFPSQPVSVTVERYPGTMTRSMWHSRWMFPCRLLDTIRPIARSAGPV